MVFVNCPHCGHKHPNSEKVCPKCKQSVSFDDKTAAPVSLGSLKGDQLEGRILGGKYRLEKIVGQGGMAFVYKATHLGLGLPVAVKIIASHLLTDESKKERFRNEARIQFSLQHPNIVRASDIIDEPGLLGIVMDWIPGPDLSVWLKREGPTPSSPKILQMFLPILEAIGYAHRKNVIHRDLKPENVLLLEEGGKLYPKVSDFGIAKIIEEQNQGLTPTGTMLGTCLYMSPEQIRGNDIDHRADIYSLGALLFHMATGVPPFLENTSYATVLAHLMHDPPTLKAKNPHADKRLEEIVRIALEKEPASRFANCGEFALHLQKALETNLERIEKVVVPNDSTVRAEEPLLVSAVTGEYVYSDEGSVLPSQEVEISAIREEPQKSPQRFERLEIEEAQGQTGELLRDSSSSLESLSQEKSRNKAFLWVVLFFCLSLLGGVGFYFLYNPSKGTSTATSSDAGGLTGASDAGVPDSQHKTPKSQRSVLLSVSSTPPGASIFIEKEARGKTPTSFFIPSNKKVSLRLEKEGFVSQTYQLSAPSNKTLHYNLKAKLVYVLDSKPPGATVFVNGREQGEKTPVRIFTTQGLPVKIRLEKKGRMTQQIVWKGTKSEKRTVLLPPDIF